MKRIDVTLILPCFNEAGIFADSLQKITSVLAVSKFSYEIIFVDDGSTDGTRDLIPGIKAAPIPGIKTKAIIHKKNMGRGQAVMDGIAAAKGEVVGYIDIDLEVSPVYIPQMVQLILQKKADIVIGKRYYRTSIGSILREVLSRGYMWFSDKMIQTGGLDTESGYKFFNRTKIVPILKQIEHKGWFWDTEIMVKSQRAGLRIYEEPVLFLRRFDKISSVHVVRDTIDYIIQLWKFRNSL